MNLPITPDAGEGAADPQRGVGAATVSPHAGSSAAGQALPNFLTLAPVEDSATRARLAQLNELARGGMNWKNALEATQDRDLLNYVVDVRRAAFVDLLPIAATDELLEIGPGLGQFTATLARRCRHVDALEVVPEQAEFTAIRSRQEGAGNVAVTIGGDDCRLPYGDRAFDGVVLNLVFEWCGSRLDSESHEQAQSRLLHEIARVLKPGGFLYLSTKNRFAMRLLLGGCDEHMFNLRFGSALPRRLAAWLMRRSGHTRSMGMLHSHDALVARLQDAGFASQRSFWAVPEMRFPTAYVPVDAAAVRAARARSEFSQGEGRKVKWLMRFVPAAWVRHVMPGLAFLAFKAP
jgi:SAM-dependent methyltransferase